MSRHVLVVEDSDIAQDVIKATLKELGYTEITCFLDPQKALMAIRNGDVKADIILLNLMMPGMDGIELCANIRALRSWENVPIIMLATRQDKELLPQAFMAGASDFVSKPFDRIELQARLRSGLRLKTELDRRRKGERAIKTVKPVAKPITKGAPAVKNPRPNVLLNQAAFLAAINTLNASVQSQLSFLALKIDYQALEDDAPQTVREELSPLMSDLLGHVSIPASDIFGKWDDDLFVLASTTQNRTRLEEIANLFLAQIKSAPMAGMLDYGRSDLPTHIGIVTDLDATAATNLSRAINLAEGNDDALDAIRHGDVSQTVLMH